MMTNNINGIIANIQVQGQTLATVKSFMYLGAIVTDEGSGPEILGRIAQTTAALTRLEPRWKDKNINISSKIRLIRTLVISIFLYTCETWTLTTDLLRKISALEMRCYRRILGITDMDRVTNADIRLQITQAIGKHDDLLTIVKKHKITRYGHVSRSSGLTKVIL